MVLFIVLNPPTIFNLHSKYHSDFCFPAKWALPLFARRSENGRCHYLPEDQKILPNHSSLLFFYFCSEKKANSVPLGNSYFAVTSYECMSTASYQTTGSFVKSRICAFVIYFIHQ